MTNREAEQLEEIFESYLRDGNSLGEVVICLANACDNLATISRANLKVPAEVTRSAFWGQCRELFIQLETQIPQ